MKGRFAFGVILMTVGLFGRLVAGSIPIPPMSPFSDSTCFSAEHEMGIAQHQTVLPSSHEKSKPPLKDNYVRPWYGLPLVKLGGGSLSLMGPVPDSLPDVMPTAPVRVNLRPPSC